MSFKREIENLPILDLIKMGREYESRLWGGAYGYHRLIQARKFGKNCPAYLMILQARNNYNTVRSLLGLSEITDWSTLPINLVQYSKSHE